MVSSYQFVRDAIVLVDPPEELQVDPTMAVEMRWKFTRFEW